MKSLYLYLIIPLAMLAAFLFTPSVGYFAAQKKIEAKIAAEKAEDARKRAEEAARQHEIERQAEEDARRHQEERERQEREREAKKEREYQDIINQLKGDLATYSGEGDKLQKEANDLELQISKARTEKEQLNRQSFELAKQVELQKVNRRNAELEIQRMVDMVAQRVNASPMSAMPPPPPPPPSKK